MVVPLAIPVALGLQPIGPDLLDAEARWAAGKEPHRLGGLPPLGGIHRGNELLPLDVSPPEFDRALLVSHRFRPPNGKARRTDPPERNRIVA